MQQASWDAEMGRWNVLKSRDVSPSAMGLELDGHLGTDIVASTAASLKPTTVLLAKPPWELQSASSISSWQVRNRPAPHKHGDVCAASTYSVALIVRRTTSWKLPPHITMLQAVSAVPYEDLSDDSSRSAASSVSPERVPWQQPPSVYGFGGGSLSRPQSRLSFSRPADQIAAWS